MATYKNNNNKSTTNNSNKIKSKYGSGEIPRNKASEKPKKDKSVSAPTKVVIRRLPPSMTEETFVESVAPLADHDYFAFISADSSLGPSAYCRAYISFKNVEDVYTFRDKFDGYVFVDQKGNEHPAMVEYAPFQKIPKRTGMKKKDARCGTIDDDADYLAFLETVTKPVTVTLPPLEAVLEEIQAQDRELKANNGLIKVKTPLLEYIEQRKAEKLRSKEEKKEERRRKEFERKKAREEERKKKREIRELHRETKKEQREEGHREMKKDQKDDSSVKVLRPERGKEDYIPEARIEKSKLDRDKERQRREDEKMKQRKEKEKLRREKEKEERQRRLDEKPKMREEEKLRTKEESIEEWQDERQHGSKPEGSRSKRYSEGRRKEREKERAREEKERENKDKGESEDMEVELIDDEGKHIEKVSEKEEKVEEKSSGRKRRDKDPRVERRIRNKDRPAMALYRPGQSRLSSRMRQDREEGAETSSSSPSPVMPAGDPKKCSSQSKKENNGSSRSDSKEEGAKAKGSNDGSSGDLAESKSTSRLKETKDIKNAKDGKFARFGKGRNSGEWYEEDGKTVMNEGKQEDKENEKEEEIEDETMDQAQSSEDLQDKSDDIGAENVSKDVKKYPGVKSMTFRRSVSRE